MTIAETREVIPTSNPDQLVMTARLDGTAVLSVHGKAGKRNGSGVQIDITGDQGDLRVTNSSALGGKGDDFVVAGARDDNLALAPLPVPDSYNWLPPSDLPSAVLELANLSLAFARDLVDGTETAPTFDDAVRLHELFDQMMASDRLAHAT